MICSLSDDDLSVHCGLFLRECVKSSPIHNHILTTGPYLELLFTHYVFNARFDSCSDVLQVLCDLLRRNKQMVAVTLNADPDLCNKVDFSFHSDTADLSVDPKLDSKRELRRDESHCACSIPSF